MRMGSYIQSLGMTEENSSGKVQIERLDEANLAGGSRSIECTLILTRNESAKALVAAGLSLIGRDLYGVYSFKGELGNVRSEDPDKSGNLNNEEVQKLIKIIGLSFTKKYKERKQIESLRYGKIMILVDQDAEGSYFKGLVINFIDHYWPDLLQWIFLEAFIPPFCKAIKGREEELFYSLSELEEWKAEINDCQDWQFKYYSSLGSISPHEAKYFFKDIERHRIKYRSRGMVDSLAIGVVFDAEMFDGRQKWLNGAIQGRKSDLDRGLPENCFYQVDKRRVQNLNDFVKNELVSAMVMLNKRSIPSMIDGLKQDQRDVLFTFFKRNLFNEEIRVDQLGCMITSETSSHQSSTSMVETIVNLARNFVGRNNVNLLLPIGQFGTRLQGGEDTAEPHQIFTKLSPLARKIFPVADDSLIKMNISTRMFEPQYYVPILPMVLVNGAEDNRFGLKTKIPCLDPYDVVRNLKLMIQKDLELLESHIGEEEIISEAFGEAFDEEIGKVILPMKPWSRGFTGTISRLDARDYEVFGEVSLLHDDDIEITELPLGVSMQTYKDRVLNHLLLNGKITNYKEFHTDTTIRFVVSFPPGGLAKAEEKDLHQFLSLKTIHHAIPMILFDSNGLLKSYETVEDILRDFYKVRRKFYQQRKDHLMGRLKAEILELLNKRNFIRKLPREFESEDPDWLICEQCFDGSFKEGIDRKKFLVSVLCKGYDPDPVKIWRKNLSVSNGFAEAEDEAEDNGDKDDAMEEEFNILEEDEQEIEKMQSETEKPSENAELIDSADYQYLVEMAEEAVEWTNQARTFLKNVSNLSVESFDFPKSLKLMVQEKLQKKATEFAKTRRSKERRLVKIEGTTIHETWLHDLDNFLEGLKKIEKEQRRIERKLILPDSSTRPSDLGERIDPLGVQVKLTAGWLDKLSNKKDAGMISSFTDNMTPISQEDVS